MKRICRTLTVIVAALAGSAAAASAEDLRIGFIFPTSGPLAGFGVQYVPGVQFVVDRFNKDGGWHGDKVVPVFYDDAGNTSGAADRFRQAIGEGVRLIITGSTSPVSAQLINDLKNWNERNPDDKAALVIMGAESKDFTAALCDFYTFKMSTNAEIRFNALANALKDKGLLGDKVASIQPNYTLGYEMQEAVEKGADKYGYKLVGSIGHDYAKLHDFAPYIERLRAMDPDTIFTASSVSDLRLMVQAAADAALPTKFATMYLDAPGNVASAGESAIGSFVAQLFNPEANADARSYRDAFKEATGTEPVYVVSNALVTMEVVAAALKSMPDADFDTTKFVLAMEGSDAAWPLGKLTMRADDHQLLLPVVVSEVSKDAEIKVDDTDMGFVPVKIVSAEEASAAPSDECKMVRP
jgi:branched-chain amino acid transport system substrate-binding protein